MRSYPILIAVLSMSLLLTFPLVAAAQGADPESVVRGYYAAVNAHDLDAAMVYFADNVEARIQPPPPNSTGIVTGKQQYRAFVQGEIADNVHVDLAGLQVAGDTVTLSAMISQDSLRKRGLAPIEYRGTYVVQGGLITSIISTATAQTLAKLQAASRVAQVPSRMPGTGGGAASESLPIRLVLPAMLLLSLTAMTVAHRRTMGRRP